jgi:hypothetical protein
LGEANAAFERESDLDRADHKPEILLANSSTTPTISSVDTPLIDAPARQLSYHLNEYLIAYF